MCKLKKNVKITQSVWLQHFEFELKIIRLRLDYSALKQELSQWDMVCWPFKVVFKGQQWRIFT